MPRLKANVPSTPWTKVPNAVIDRHLPTLRDTELRILLVLIRATAGWNREGRSVPLTYRTLIQRTGRRSEAVARALSSLRDKGLVHTSSREVVRSPKKVSSEGEGQQTKTD